MSGEALEAGGHEREEAPGIVSLVCVVCRALNPTGDVP